MAPRSVKDMDRDELLKLAKFHEKEKEELLERLSKLQVELENKQALELEIERLRGAIQEMSTKMKEDAEKAQTKMKQLEEKMKAKEEEFEDIDSLIQSLVVKERKNNDEMQDVRKEMISYLSTVTSPCATIRIKRMGELDTKPFLLTAKKSANEDEDADIKAGKLCSEWQGYVENSSWHPFKMVQEGDKTVEYVDEGDEKLKRLREVYGDEVFQSVATALKEMNEYNASGRYVTSEIWNFGEGRKATTMEAFRFLISLINWEPPKRERDSKVSSTAFE